MDLTSFWLFRLGEVTSYISLLAPLPTFFLCGKDKAR